MRNRSTHVDDDVGADDSAKLVMVLEFEIGDDGHVVIAR